MKKLRSALQLALIPVFLYFLVGCSGGSGGGNGTIVVNISSGAFAGTAIDQEQTLTLTAQVTNDRRAAGVMWTLTLNGAACSPGCGQLMNSSTTQTSYNAPPAGNAAIRVTITATSVADGTKHQDFVLSITPKPLVNAQNLAQSIAGAAYGPQQVVESGGAGTLTWAITGALPAALTGLTINSSTGMISGTPAGPAGSFSFTAQVTDSGNPAIQASGLVTIKLVLPPAPTITSTSPLNPAATVEVAYNFTFTANGAGPFTWAAAPPLTNGLTFNINGTITGTPTAPATTLNFNVTVTDKFGQPSAATPFSLGISAARGNPNDAKLNGNYAFEVSAWDNFNLFSPGAIGGSFVADGNGNLTSGVVDRSLSSTVATNSAFVGTYNIGNDGRGTLTININGGVASYTIRFALQANGNAKIIAFGNTPNTNFQGSGVIKKQDPTAFSLSKITSDYVMGIEGVTLSNGHRSAAAGRFTSDGAGNVNTGTIDISGPLSSSGALTLGGNIGALDPVTGRGTITFTVAGQNGITLAYYVVSPGELLVLDVDTVSRISYTGSILAQKRPAVGFTLGSLNGTVVFEFTGYDVSSTQSNTGVGFITADGAGNVTNGFLDENSDASFQSNALPAGSTYTIDADGNGRGILKLTGGVHQQVLYFGDVNKVIFLEGTPTDVGKDATLGIGEPQSAGITSAMFMGNYAFGTQHPVTPTVVDYSGEAIATGAGGTFAGTADLTFGQGGPANGPDVPINATYMFTAGQNGRATVTLTPQGGDPMHLVFWFVSAGKAVGVMADATTTNSAIVTLIGTCVGPGCIPIGGACFGPSHNCCPAPFPHHSFCSNPTGFGTCIEN
jgi:hypothetical protein